MGWAGVRAARVRRTGRLDLATQHPQLGLPQLRPWLDAEFLGQPVAHRAEELQGRRLLAGAGQRHHQPGGQALVQRLVGGEFAEPHGGRLVPAGAELHVRLGQPSDQPPRLDRHDRRVGPQPRARVGQHRPPPAVQGQPEPLFGGGLVAGIERVPPAGGQLVEVQQVELVGGELEPVARPQQGQPASGPVLGGPVRFEQRAELADVPVQQPHAGARRIVAPERVHDLVPPDHPVRLDREQAEQVTRERRAQFEGGVAAAHRERSEHSHPQLVRLRRGAVQQQLALGVGEPQGGHESEQGLRPRPRHPALFEIAEPAHADAGPVGELLLGQPGPDPESMERRAQTGPHSAVLAPRSPRDRVAELPTPWYQSCRFLPAGPPPGSGFTTFPAGGSTGVLRVVVGLSPP